MTGTLEDIFKRRSQEGRQVSTIRYFIDDGTNRFFKGGIEKMGGAKVYEEIRDSEEMLSLAKKHSEQHGQAIDFLFYSQHFPLERQELEAITEAKRSGCLNHALMVFPMMHKKSSGKIISRYNPEIHREFTEHELDGIVWEYSMREFRNVYYTFLLGEEPFPYNHCYIVLGPSGAGKSTILSKLLNDLNGAELVVKTTIRERRGHSLNEGTAHVTKEEFLRSAKENRVIGCCEYLDNLYGYSKDQIDVGLASGKDLFIDTVVPSVALEMKKIYGERIKLVLLSGEEELIENNLIRRYQNMPVSNPEQTRQIARTQDQRLIDYLKRESSYESIRLMVDLYLKSNQFPIALQKLRNFVINCRFSKVVMPNAGVLEYR